MKIKILGGGLSGCEAAYQAKKFGLEVVIYEMKPKKFSAAHKSENLCELVCSNSLKSISLENASGILKEELRILDSLVIEAAYKNRVPAGIALAVDREKFSLYVTKKIEEAGIEIVREEVTSIDENELTIVATGPLTSEPLQKELERLCGSHLYFYDATSPIVLSDSIDMNFTFRASRYGKGESDYLNCPMDEKEYYEFVDAILKAEKVPIEGPDKNLYFEGCIPIEELCKRGKDTLRFGPMRPVGLIDPKTNKMPFCVVQLRQEDLDATMYSMVGFQTRMKWNEQKRVFRMIPALRNAIFLRYGTIHRNTYINSPKVLLPTLQLKKYPNIIIAGCLCGVEGYVESIATGLLAGINAARIAASKKPSVPPRETALGSLVAYITDESRDKISPMNINFGLFPNFSLKGKRKKKFIAKIAIDSIKRWRKELFSGLCA